VIKLSDIRKTYKSRSGQEVVALDDVSFELPARGLVFIVGKSGSGKSTLLNMLGGLDSPTSGSIILDGVGKLAEGKTLDAYRNTHLGFVFQEFHLLDTLTVFENISLAREMKGESVNDETVNEALEAVDLSGLIDRYPEELSGGQKQRVAIARALIKNPNIILADEPTGNLDSTTSKDIIQLLKALAGDRLVIVVTHDKDSAREYGDRVIELKDGRIADDTQKQASENDKYVSSANTDLPRLKNAKLSNKSVFKFVFSALNHKKAKLIASVALSVIAIALFGISFIISTYSTEKQIAKNIGKAGVTAFFAGQIKDITENKGITQNRIFNINKAVPSTVFDDFANADNSLAAYGLYNAYWFSIPYISELIGGGDSTVAINKPEDIKSLTRCDLLPGYLELADDRIYLTDFMVYILSDLEVVTDDGFGELGLAIAYYYIDGQGVSHDLTRDVPADELIGVDLWARAGKTLIDSEQKIATIGGIISTNYSEIMQRYDAETDYERLIDQYVCNFIYSSVFCSRDAIIKRFKPEYQFNIGYNGGQETHNTLPLLYHDIQIYAGTNVVNREYGFGVALAGENKYGENIASLADNEIILSADLYNSIFNESVQKYGDFLSPMPQHLNETISIRIRDKSNRIIATLLGYKIVDLAQDNMLNSGTIYVPQRAFDELYPASINPIAIMVGVDGSSGALIKELRKSDYYIYSPFSIGLYEFELKFAAFDIVFWGAAGVLLVFSMLLIMNFISGGVMAKKKEIGILRAMGARLIDTERIFISEAGIIAAITAVVSIMICVPLSILINYLFAVGTLSGASVLSFNFAVIPVIIGISGLTTAISAALPAYRVSKMKPADAIKKVA
jgi:ABC-type lipoprotein export system ATPase subunit